MRQALLDPVAVKASFVQKRRASTAQVVDGEWFQRQPGGLGALRDDLRDAVERGLGHAAVGVVAGRQYKFGAGGACVQCHEVVERRAGQMDDVWVAAGDCA